MKGIIKNYYICPKERLNFFYNQISEIKQQRKKSRINNLISIKNEQKNLNYNDIYESLPTYNKTSIKIPNMNNRNHTFNHNNIKSFSKSIRVPKQRLNNNKKNQLKPFNSDKQLYVKDTRILIQYKKYKDIFKQNEENYDIVKNTFIDDYKKNLKALNNYLTINDKGINNTFDFNNNNKNQETVINNYIQKPKILKKIKRINNPIQLSSSIKENDFFFNYNKKRLNNKSKTFKEIIKTNSRLENEKEIFNNYNLYNINNIKRRKLIDYDCLSIGGQKKGVSKTNQDSFLIFDSILDCKDVKIFGVFDGHGEHGDLLTQEIRDLFKDFFSNIKYYDNLININANSIYNYLSKNNFEKIYDIFKKINEIIHQKYISNNYCIKCGTTTNILILFSKKNIINKIISMNLGNTKSILINENNQIKQLNICHTPNNTNEKIRIEKNGGEIGRAEWINEGPLRIWYKGKKDSGLSITRSFGDFEAEKLGVISIPDIEDYNIDEEKIKIIIIATEGLWTFLKNEKIMDIILPYYKSHDIKSATKKLTEIAKNIWKIKNPCEISDITIIILFFK